jgi:uncharacterized delta-60 repeat protein
MIFRAALLLALAGTAPPLFAQQGALDRGFGNTGVRTYGNMLAGERVNALLADDNGAAFAAGVLHKQPDALNDADMVVMRVLRNGDLDPDWGNAGLREISMGGVDEGATALLRVSASGGAPTAPELLVAGYTKAVGGSSSTDFAVARLTHAGALDPTFGGDVLNGVPPGVAVFHMGPVAGTSDHAVALARQSNQRILVLGWGRGTTPNSNDSFMVARLTGTGQLDPEFDGDGRLFIPRLGDAAEYPTAIALHRDGRLDLDDSFVVAGYVFGTTRSLLRRYHADGTPDLDFGNQGTLVILEENPGGGAPLRGLRRIDAAVLQDDGKIVVAGRAGDNGFVFLRYSARGVLDTSFGDNGRKLVKFSGATDIDAAASLTLQADGKILAGGVATARRGAANTPEADFAAVRLTRNGQLDPTWDGDGRATYPVVSPDGDQAYAIALMSDGSVMLGGDADVEANAGGNFDAAFMRLQGDPSLFRDGFED